MKGSRMRLRRQRRQQPEMHHHLANEYTCGECGKLLGILTVAEAMDWVEQIVLEESELAQRSDRHDVEHAWSAITLLRTALHLPAGRSPAEREAANGPATPGRADCGPE
jgi:hypothetical protein